MLIVRRRAMWKYYITGVLISTVLGWFTLAFLMIVGYSGSMFEILYSLPGGFLAGYFGYWMDRKYASSLLHKIGLVLLTIILSILLSYSSMAIFIEPLG
jgi:hypothetical protein